MHYEGFEDKVLKGFTKIAIYKPRVILIEQLNTLIDQNTYVGKFIIDSGYRLFAKSVDTFFYIL